MSDYVTKTNVLSALARFKENTDALYETKADANDIEAAIDNIEDGTTVVEKAKCDKNGNQIDTTYAKQDGYYKNLGAGTAEQLISTVFTEDKVPYNFRTAGGSIDIGDREEDEIVGGSFTCNQLAPETNSTNWGTSSASATYATNKITFTASQQYGSARINTESPLVVGHRYLISVKAKVYSGGVVRFGLGDPGFFSSQGVIITLTADGAYHVNATVGTYSQSGTHKSIIIMDFSRSGWEEVEVSNIQVFDLTQMFGSQIADYIYNLETGNAGAGVAWFRELFPKPYYAYNAGSLESVCVSAHNMTGFNQFDYDTGKARILANIEYKIEGTYSSLAFADLNGNALSITPDSDGLFTSTVEAVLTVTGGDDSSTCVFIHWDGERDGEYEPYVLNSYVLDHTKVLRGIPKLDGNNKLYFDGDVYKSDGGVMRNYFLVNLGDMSWKWRSDVGCVSGILPETTPHVLGGFGILCQKYVTNNVGAPYMSDKEISGAPTYNYNQVIIKDSDITSSDIVNSKIAKLNNVYAICELATPTTESADPYTNPQIVSDWGTEEYVDYPESQGTRDMAIPVGHNTKYQANLKAKLEMAPNSPSGDGEYVVKQTSGENAYIPLSSASAIVALNTRVPACPTSTDGTFVLKATVSDGAVTYSWVAE